MTEFGHRRILRLVKPATSAGIRALNSRVRIKNVDGRVKPGHDVERAPARDYRSKARPTRKVWNDSLRLTLTLLEGDPVQLEAAELEPVQLVVRPKVLV